MLDTVKRYWEEDDLLAFAMFLTFLLPVFPINVYLNQRGYSGAEQALVSFAGMFGFWFCIYFGYVVAESQFSGDESNVTGA